MLRKRPPAIIAADEVSASDVVEPSRA